MQRMLDIAGITQNPSKPLLVLACECDEFADHVPITLALVCGIYDSEPFLFLLLATALFSFSTGFERCRKTQKNLIHIFWVKQGGFCPGVEANVWVAFKLDRSATHAN